MDYLSAKQTAQKWGVSIQRIQVICKQGRVPGAFIVGNSWAIPADAQKPKDENGNDRLCSGDENHHSR